MKFFNNYTIGDTENEVTSETDLQNLSVGVIIVNNTNGNRFEKGSKGQWKKIKILSPLTFEVIGTSLYITTT